MSTESSPRTKSPPVVLIAVVALIVVGATLIGWDFLSRLTAAPTAAPTAIARAPGSGEETPAAVAGETQAVEGVTPAPTQVGGVDPAKPAAAAGAEATLTQFVVTPPPQPTDVSSGVNVAAQAAIDAGQSGAPPTTPPNMITATFTPEPVGVAQAASPGNATTSEFRDAVATAVAATAVALMPAPQSTATLKPAATKRPTSAPRPLLVRITPKPWPSPTPPLPSVIPSALHGKILFLSDREDESEELYALDPANGALYAVPNGWHYYEVALARDATSPDGQFSIEVQKVTMVTKTDSKTGIWKETETTTQLFVRDNQFKDVRRLTPTDGWRYDPSWSPAGDRIAFVTTQPGNDEIYTVRPDGSDMQRLTSNTWEWDKHPSWSPDGQQIVFYSNREGGRPQLWVMNADGSNQRLLITSPANDWDPVWVKNPAAAAESSSSSAGGPTPLAKAIVTAERVNIRSGPTTTGQVLASGPAGQSYDIVGRNAAGDWWQIRLDDGRLGWVFGDLVTTQGDLAAVPLATG